MDRGKWNGMEWWHLYDCNRSEKEIQVKNIKNGEDVTSSQITLLYSRTPRILLMLISSDLSPSREVVKEL